MQRTKLRYHSLRLLHELCQATTGYVVDQRRGTVGNGLLQVCKLDAEVLRRQRQGVDVFGRVVPSLSQVGKPFSKLVGRFDECDDTANSANHFHRGWSALPSSRISTEREDLVRLNMRDSWIRLSMVKIIRDSHGLRRTKSSVRLSCTARLQGGEHASLAPRIRAMLDG